MKATGFCAYPDGYLLVGPTIDQTDHITRLILPLMSRLDRLSSHRRSRRDTRRQVVAGQRFGVLGSIAIEFESHAPYSYRDHPLS